ncbi:conserved hypothetical protein (plasmid) [Helicobacter pylori B8]|uniref:Uncharacterized protein n=1 Tax=Helicobacter pylori (strain B8) TaxID=693745 RepID=D7GAY0_HELP3|nr:conserved hypothetical protein [Helicobacter pylori B8]
MGVVTIKSLHGVGVFCGSLSGVGFGVRVGSWVSFLISCFDSNSLMIVSVILLMRFCISCFCSSICGVCWSLSNSFNTFCKSDLCDSN